MDALPLFDNPTNTNLFYIDSPFYLFKQVYSFFSFGGQVRSRSIISHKRYGDCIISFCIKYKIPLI